MTKPIIRIHNLATDEIIDREMNDAEFEAYEADQAVAAAQAAAEAAKAEQRAALLERLGITAEEAQLLLGGN
jgi:acyl-CoA reductase-like NAD-dependent aldehyde dehydrogenase